VLQGKVLKVTDGTSQDFDLLAGSELLQLEWLRLYLRDHRRHLSVGINLRSVLGFLHNTCRDVLNHGDGRRHIPAERTRQNGTIFPYGFLPSTIQPLKGGQQHPPVEQTCRVVERVNLGEINQCPPHGDAHLSHDQCTFHGNRTMPRKPNPRVHHS
jgi:hypothetical protein